MGKVREGQSVHNGKAFKTAEKLEKLGLVRIVDRRKVRNRIGGLSWQLTIEPIL